jgi:hypothetical protein
MTAVRLLIRRTNDGIIERRHNVSERPTFHPATSPSHYPKSEHILTDRNKKLNISRVYSLCSVTTLDVSCALEAFLARKPATFHLRYSWKTMIVMLKYTALVYGGNHINQIKCCKTPGP